MSAQTHRPASEINDGDIVKFQTDPDAPRVRRHRVALTRGHVSVLITLACALSIAFGMLFFETVATLTNIQDVRAGQVTWMLAAVLLALWSYSMFRVLRSR